MPRGPPNPDHVAGETRQKPADFIATHPVFTLAEFRENQRQRGRGHQAARAILKYHLRTGRIWAVKRGVYVHPGGIDPWLLGSRMAPDAVLGYGGALSCRGIGGLGWQIAYLTAHPGRNVEWNEVIYEPVRVRPEGGNSPRTETVLRDGHPVTVCRVEDALVDVFDRQDLGPLLAAVEHLRHEPSLSLPSVLARARLLARSTLNARLGYVLDARPDMPRDDLLQLERSLPAAPIWFDASERGGTLLPRWRVHVPRAVREVVEGHRWWTPAQRRAFTPPLSSATPPRHSVE